ncbi:ras-related protein Rab-22A-like [Lagopus muta]|uniref:ras-related protein Rab-22A-like n=1 Tax=Lagopus muta TaxID=64668 RepID=UPI0020A04AD5|nr:ras-related protein Rab-22A-like [Lagopus muta]
MVKTAKLYTIRFLKQQNCMSEDTAGKPHFRKTITSLNTFNDLLHIGEQQDIAGQERFHALAPVYYRGSAAAIIVYNITKEETFSTLKNWVRQHGPPNIVAIAGNKCDLNDVRKVMEKDAKNYSDSIHAIFVETSAKNAININELLTEATLHLWSVCPKPEPESYH